jgi:SAM-dependent methyltransferase
MREASESAAKRPPRVDYDRIAHLYDEAQRDHDVDANLVAFFGDRPDLSPALARILDVGCGTGKQLMANRVRFRETLAVGLDPFIGMLRIARTRRPDIAWVRGDGSEMPLRSGSVDYCCNQFSYQHIRDKDGFVREVSRVLKPGGRFALTTIDPWSMEGWIVYRFFPEARDLDARDFLPADRIAALMRENGFANVRAVRDHRPAREDLRQFLAYARQRHRMSQLLALADGDYRAGINRIEGTIADAGRGQAAADSEFCLLTITADKRSPSAIGV